MTRAKRALIDAFQSLVVQRPYEKIFVPDIVFRARVARSTFYEHFRNKDDIMRTCLGHVMEVVATAGFPDADIERLEAILDHFLEFDRFTKTCLNTSVAAIVIDVLGGIIERRLDAEDLAPPRGSSSRALDAIQIAESSIGLIRAWLNTRDHLPTKRIAKRLNASARALLS